MAYASPVIPPKLSADLIEAFAGAYLSPGYDNKQPVADFHREGWELYSSDVEVAALAAPREHAKSTAFTHVFTLAVLCFRAQDYAILVSATEDLAMDHLGDIAKEFRENDELRQDFGIKRLVVDARTEVIVEFTDGHQCRLLAKGSGQKMRGLKWRGKRPGLIIGDDLEEDEQVESADRRRKFRRWIFRALLPCKRRGGIVRLHGTILHEDSLLARLMKDKSWASKFYKAHRAFDDFTEILWPEQFPESRLRAIRQRFIEQQDASGYSQEYLNDPFDNSDRYLLKHWFLPMQAEDFDAFKTRGVGLDFAISKADKANRTSFTVGGLCSQNILHIEDQRVGRMDSLEIVETFFEVHYRWHPDIWFAESGQIWLALKPMLEREMRRRGVFLVLVEMTPIKDKAARGRALQKRMRNSACRFDKTGEWYVPYEEELLRFTGMSEAVLDDQFDSTATLALGFESMPAPDSVDGEEFDEDSFLRQRGTVHQGRSAVTGY